MEAKAFIIIISSVSLFAFALVFVGFVIFHNRKMIIGREKLSAIELERSKQMLIDSVAIQELERARMGANIHDDLGPMLLAIKLKLSKQIVNEKNIEFAKQLVQNTIESVRNISLSLYPNTLENFGLKVAIEELINRIQNATEISIVSKVDDSIENKKLDYKLGLYRLIQEFCNNSVKHSKCQNLQIEIIFNDKPHIRLKDDGIGFKLENIKTNGLGIKNMKMRSEVLGLNFQLNSTPGKGTEILLT